MKTLKDYVVFHDRKLERRYADRKIPISTLYEAYFDGAVDIHDLGEFLRNRNHLVTYSLTLKHLVWAFSHFLPEVAIHSRAQDRRIVREHYDRGNDFFEAFLGKLMVYTSGYFRGPDDSLEEAQENKMNLVCRKLQLEPRDSFLDIGCGWGTLVAHAARQYGAEATGVTIAERQAAFASETLREEGLEGRARVLCQDYREIGGGPFDKIVCVEMVEHVGVKNLVSFFRRVRDLLSDDGIFLLQWTGLRRGMRPEDLIWSLFMNKYIFPGADASLSPSRMIAATEKAGFEASSIENISAHYIATIERWHRNWIANKSRILERYGERWFRIWHFFLGWSPLVGENGTAACFQLVLHKNVDRFDRRRLGIGVAAFEDAQPETQAVE